jgi:hypothetical protein
MKEIKNEIDYVVELFGWRGIVSVRQTAFASLMFTLSRPLSMARLVVRSFFCLTSFLHRDIECQSNQSQSIECQLVEGNPNRGIEMNHKRGETAVNVNHKEKR